MSIKLKEGCYTPEGKKLGEYKSDVYNIDMTKNSGRITGDVVKQKLIYQPNEYMLASRCFGADFGTYYLMFMIFEVVSNCVTASDSFTSCLFRPVVELSSNVKLTPNADKTEWTIK